MIFGEPVTPCGDCVDLQCTMNCSTPMKAAEPTIRQRHEQDCFLCCIAMAIGMSYERAALRWGDELVNHVANSGLVGSKNIEKAFGSVGLQRDRDYTTVYAQIPGHAAWETAAEIKKFLWGRRACIQVESKNYRGRFHIIYWDGKELHDPSPLKTYTWHEVEPIFVWLFNESVARAAAHAQRRAIL